MATKSLGGRVALVTGATRGIGKGIAIELGAAGATVYITGRTMISSDGQSGSLEETAEIIRNRGGQCIPICVDHENVNETESLFHRIATEQDGRLDILVNNAFKAGTCVIDNMGKSFWEVEPTLYDEINNVSVRNYYYCTVYAARLMVPRKQGLIVTISSLAGLTYFCNVPFGIGKAGCDRLAADTAVELKPHNIASISLWPGLVATETVNSLRLHNELGKMIESLGKTETPEYVGRIIVHLAQNSSLMQYTGKIVTTADYGIAHGIVDTD
ncbi:unnamed protein product, partial [Rotaria sordida]